MQRTALIPILMLVCLWPAAWTVAAESADEAPAAAETPSTASTESAEVLADVTAEGLADAEEPLTAEPLAAVEAPAEQAPAAQLGEQPADKPLDTEMEDVKKALLKLKRDLVILEEDLLFPASSQVAVFLSMDVGEFFALDAVTVKLNGKDVANHLYTNREVDALYRGGVQKLYVGNVKQGHNRVTAFFTGRGPNGRDYRRATTVDFEKSFEPTFVELAISDSTAKYQPEFRAAVSN